MLIVFTTDSETAAIRLVFDIIWTSRCASRSYALRILVTYNTTFIALRILLDTLFDSAAHSLSLIIGNSTGFARVAIKYLNAIFTCWFIRLAPPSIRGCLAVEKSSLIFTASNTPHQSCERNLRPLSEIISWRRPHNIINKWEIKQFPLCVAV